MDTRTVGKALLEKVRCIAGLLDHEDKPSSETFNDLVFGTSSPPIPSRTELIYWYVTWWIFAANCSFILCLRIFILRWAALGASDNIELDVWISTLVELMDVLYPYPPFLTPESAHLKRKAAGQLHL